MDNNIMSVQSNSSAKSINSAIITVAFLNQHNACKEGIEFFERNFSESLFPNGLDLSKVKITGDYKGYFNWINYILKYKYDSNGNKIKKIFPNGDIYKYEYDSKGNMTKKIFPNGNVYEWKYEYDSNGNMTKEVTPDGNIYEWKYEYDFNGNIIKTISPNGNIYEWQYEYDLIGRLIQAENCHIEYLE